MEELSNNELLLIAGIGVLWLTAYAIKQKARNVAPRPLASSEESLAKYKVETEEREAAFAELLATKIAEKLK